MLFIALRTSRFGGLTRTTDVKRDGYLGHGIGSPAPVMVIEKWLYRVLEWSDVGTDHEQKTFPR